jgi:hypothetical protein
MMDNWIQVYKEVQEDIYLINLSLVKVLCVNAFSEMDCDNKFGVEKFHISIFVDNDEYFSVQEFLNRKSAWDWLFILLNIEKKA